MLADYRSDILDQRHTDEIEGHLARCEQCAEELRLLDAVLALVDANTSQVEPPVGLWNGVYNRITQPQPRASVWRNIARNWLMRPARAAAMGAAAMALIAGLMFSGLHRGENVPPVSRADSEYIQAHALYAGQAPLADRASYLTLVSASSGSSEVK